jgi:predicted alpha/beta-fold hydrolase
MKYISPSWLPGGNLQTIWPALFSRRHFGPAPLYRRERWTAPDADFIDVDWLDSLPESESDRSVERPLLVLFHGLEGSSSSHYAIAFADFARHNRLNYAVPHFRGCSGQINLAPRAYHSGDYEEIGWVLERLRKTHNGPMIVVGISLGGNALLRWVQEMGADASRYVSAVAAVSAPVDLVAGGHAIGTGFNRMVYTRMFLRTMKPKALRKLDQHPGLFNREALMQARDLYDFDNVFTAPLHDSGIHRTIGIEPHPSHVCVRYKFRHWWSIPAMTLSFQLGVCPPEPKWVPRSHCGSQRTGDT